MGAEHLGRKGDTRERKRERDRQNQRRKRGREKEALQELERQKKSLEHQVELFYDGADKNVQQLSDTVQMLRAQNHALSERLRKVDAFVQGWTGQDEVFGNTPETLEDKMDDAAGSSLALPTISTVDGSIHDDTDSVDIARLSMHSFSRKQQMDYESIRNWAFPEPANVEALHSIPWTCPAPNTHGNDLSALSLPLRPLYGLNQNDGVPKLDVSPPSTQATELKVPISQVEEVLEAPKWERLPIASKVHKCFDPYGDTIRLVKGSPKQLRMCSPEPKVLDLLFGGSSNPLSSAVYQSTLYTPMRQTERLAINWITYLAVMWMIHPSEESFNRMPGYLHPTATQLFVPHPPIFDYVVWPQMRDNLIKHGLKYCRPEVFGLLFCTCRVRDTPNSDFLIRNGEANIQIDPFFLHRISTLDGMVLLDRFWNEYPELVEGMDPEKFMIREKDLI